MIYEYFFPDYSYRTVGDIDVCSLAGMGIRYVLLDIDNTLVPYTTMYPDSNALSFLNELKENGIEFCFVSNNHAERVLSFNKELKAPVFPRAKKPLLFGINKAMKELGAKKENTALIGDQIFTDVWGGKRAGILTFLVEPIKECESLFFRFKRYFEKKIIRSYRNNSFK